MIDISDGLTADLAHLCAQSHVGARLDLADIPVAAGVGAIAQACGTDGLALALHGGEDYELLFTVPEASGEEALARVRATGTPATVIGRVTASTAGLRARDAQGTEGPLERRGWDHLRDATASRS
jgi:thiamine-monophosphate kinase